MPDGLVIVDKPSGLTSHDVVARVRRLAGTRKVGHAGTLDPMATGVLVLGVGRATRLLHHLVLADKHYTASIRLGQSSSTDDAEGEIRSVASAAGLTDDDVQAAMRRLTGEISQAPSAVSAIKVAGERAYRRVRAGEDVRLPPRPVTVSRFDALGFRRHDELVDVDVEVVCSSGTYVRALARDLGAALRVGGHLIALRRTRVGPFALEDAHTLDQLAEQFEVLSLADAVRAALPVRAISADEARELSFGRAIAAAEVDGPYGAIAPGGAVSALLRDDAGRARPVVVFTPAGSGEHDQRDRQLASLDRRLAAAGVAPDADPVDAWRRLRAAEGPVVTVIDLYKLSARRRGLTPHDLAAAERHALARSVMPDVWPGWAVTAGSDRSGDVIEVVEYDESWPARFETWRDAIRTALGPVTARIEHVGSTAVPGMTAKPIIDVQVSVADPDDETSYLPQFEAIGLQLRSRDRLHRYFRPFPDRSRDVHVHVCELGSAWELAHLLFRDYLRTHPEARGIYARAKREAATEWADDGFAYTDAKTAVILRILERARE